MALKPGRVGLNKDDVDEFGHLIRGGGTPDYNDLINKPTLNNKELTGNTTLNQIGVYSKQQIDNKIGNVEELLAAL